MKREWMKYLGSTALAFALIGGATAYAAGDNGYNAWNTDDAEGLTYEEWDAGFNDEEQFDAWDADGDGLLDEDEFNEGVFSSYDDNENDTLDEPEYGDYNDDLGDEGFWDV